VGIWGFAGQSGFVCFASVRFKEQELLLVPQHEGFEVRNV
jgi:hypothetical protein